MTNDFLCNNLKQNFITWFFTALLYLYFSTVKFDMKLTHSQYNHLADATKEFSAILFGALVVSGIFSTEPVRVGSIIIGVIIFLLMLFFSIYLNKKVNSNG